MSSCWSFLLDITLKTVPAVRHKRLSLLYPPSSTPDSPAGAQEVCSCISLWWRNVLQTKMGKYLLLWNCSQIPSLDTQEEKKQKINPLKLWKQMKVWNKWLFQRWYLLGVIKSMAAERHGLLMPRPPSHLSLKQLRRMSLKVFILRKSFVFCLLWWAALIYLNSLQRNWSDSDVWLVSAHLGSCPAEQRISKLADGRDHQVHSGGSPRPASGLQATFMNVTRGPGAVIITLALGAWTGSRSCITFVERIRTSSWVCGSRVHF